MNAIASRKTHEGKLELATKDESTAHIVSAPPTPADLLSLAMSQGADLDRLERLMALQERWEANQAEKAFVVAMTAFKAKPIDIQKRKHVRFQTQKGVTEYHHAELSDVVDAAIIGMAENGFSHAWEPQQLEGGLIEVTCVVTHAQGHSKRTTLRSRPDDSGNKNNIQAVGSAITYLQRYTLLLALGLATRGMDDDGQGTSTPKAEPADQPDSAREKIINDLYACADNGMTALMKAWKEMPEASRQRVGAEFRTIKARAQEAGA